MKNLNKDVIVKVITGIIMLIIVVFLVKQNEHKLPKLDNIKEFKIEKLQKVEKRENKGTQESKFFHKVISPEEYKSKLESGKYEHLDIRTKGEYHDERISDGLNIDFYAPDFKEQLAKLDKDKKYIYHCRSGSRSARAVSIFEELGFKEVLELDGGINNWKNYYPTIAD